MRSRHSRSYVPGKPPGKVRLGAPYSQVVQVLGGEPKAGDAAMGGKLWATWYNGPHSDEETLPSPNVRQVNVYFQRDLVHGEPSGTARVRAIQVNSPYFHTASGAITPGRSTLAAIRRAYPNLKRTAQTVKLSHGQADYYQDRKKGIGFVVRRAEPVSQGICQSIVVFAPGSPYSPYFATL